MIFGSSLGKRDIVELMVEHPIAKKIYSKRKRIIIKKYGHLIFKLLGYPLNVGARQKARTVMKYVKPENGIILDAGCGIGYFSFELAANFELIFGVDIDFEDVRLANQIAKNMGIQNSKFGVIDISNLPISDGKFNVVLLLDVIEHIRDDEKLIKELARVLKPGGYLILCTAHRENMQEYSKQESKNYSIPTQLDIPGGHVRSGYSIERLYNILNKSGFENINYTFIYKKFITNFGSPVLFPFTYLFSMFDNLLPNNKGEGIIIKAKKKAA